MKSNLKKQVFNLLSIYGLIIAFLILIRLQDRIPIYNLTRDVFVVLEAPFYTGLLQNIGAFIWCSSFAIYLFTYAVFNQRKNKDNRESKYFLFFLVYSGMTSLILMLDDFFILHDKVYPTYLHLSEVFVFKIYFIIIMVYIIIFRKIIIRTPFFYLILALLFFTLSLIIDVAEDIFVEKTPFIDEDRILFEDGSKLLGIVSWCFYCCSVCLKKLIQTSK